MSYRRKQQDKTRLKRLCIGGEWPPPAWFDGDRGRVIRIYLSDCGARWLKIHSNRVIRRKVKNVRFELPSGKRQYQKLFDYWNALF